MGLTMAETLILILFALLLAIAAAFAVQKQKLSKSEDRYSKVLMVLNLDTEGVGESDVVAQIEKLNQENIELRKLSEESKNLATRLEQDIEDIFRVIERQSDGKPSQVGDVVDYIRELGSETIELELALEEARVDVDRKEWMEGIIREIERQSGHELKESNVIEYIEEQGLKLVLLEQEMEDIFREIERQSGSRLDQASDVVEHIRELGSERTQLRQALTEAEGDAGQKEQLAGIVDVLERRTGNKLTLEEIGEYIGAAYDSTRKSGNTYPSCWLNEEGKVESIFEVTFMSEGIRVSRRDLPHRNAEFEKLPLKSAKMNNPLKIEEFKSQFKRLFEWSERKECRFYVILYTTEQQIDIGQRNAVDDYFWPGSKIRSISSR